MKRFGFMFVLAIILIVLIFFINQSRIVTYEDFIEENLDENDEIVYIIVSSYALLQEKEFTVKIEDPATIKKIIEEPSMKIKKGFKRRTPSIEKYPNSIHIQGKSSSFLFRFNKSSIFDGKKYKIIDDEINVYDVIRRMDLDWEIGIGI